MVAEFYLKVTRRIKLLFNSIIDICVLKEAKWNFSIAIILIGG